MKKSIGAQSVVFPTPTWCVCAYDDKGRATGMTAAWGGICCSAPPSLCVSMRAATYTHGQIMARKAFTVNVPGEAQAAVADYFGIVSGREIDKFKEAGLTAVKSELVDAPYIAEFPMVVELKLSHVVEVGKHTQFIGEIVDVKVDEEVMDEKGNPLIDLVKPIIYAAGSRTYHGVGPSLGKAFSIGKTLKS